MTDIDLDKLEALAEAALPYWRAVDLALGGNPIAADLVAPFAASVSPATIKSLIASAREAAAEIEKLREALKPLADCEIVEPDTPLPDDVSARYLFSMGEIRAARSALSARAAQMDGEG